MVVGILPYVMRTQGLYRSAALMPGYRFWFSLLKAVILGMLLVIAATYLIRDVRYTRGGLAFFTAFAYLGLWFGRRLFLGLYQRKYAKDRIKQRAIVVGAGVLGRHLVEELAHRTELGINLVGLLTRHDEKIGSDICGVPVLGTYEDILKVVQTEQSNRSFLRFP